jgi:hypothetical protein
MNREEDREVAPTQARRRSSGGACADGWQRARPRPRRPGAGDRRPGAAQPIWYALTAHPEPARTPSYLVEGQPRAESGRGRNENGDTYADATARAACDGRASRGHGDV